MSIRLRLTVWYTTIVATVVVIFGASLYYLLTLAVLSTVDRQLETTANQVEQLVQVRLSPLALETVLIVPDLDVIVAPGLYVQIYDIDADQIIVSRSMGEAALPLENELLTTVVNTGANRRTVEVGETRVRLFSTSLLVDGQVKGVIQVGATLTQLDQTQRQLLSIVLVGGVVAVVVSAVFGALLARAALRPIDEITQTALIISRTEDLSRRLEVRGPEDEVGRLTLTFNEMLARLETLFGTQQRLIGDVSHELRTPLTTIQGNVDLLRRGAAEDPETRQQTLSDIEGEVSRMARLVADLLLLARADAGVRLEARPVELDTLLLEVYRQARVMGDSVEVKLGHEDQAVVLGDADRLRQLLLNLVDNAVHYTPAGGEVRLSLYNRAGWAHLQVADTGIGIPPQDLAPGADGVPAIFQRFYRSDRARSRRYGGAGLGLSIAYWIAQAHHGDIVVESEVGEGSTFTVKLPTIQA